MPWVLFILCLLNKKKKTKKTEVSLKIRSVETIRNVLILKVIVKVNKEIVHAQINY